MTLPPSRTGLASGTLRWSMRIRQSAWLRSLYWTLSESSRRRIAGAAQRSISERPVSPPGPAWDQASASDIPKQRSEQAALAVNIVVCLNGRLGLGKNARRYASAFMEHGAQMSLQDVDLDLTHHWNEDATSQCLSERAPHPVTQPLLEPIAEDAGIMLRDDVIEGRHVRAVATLSRRLCFIASGRRFRAAQGRERAGRQARDCHAMVGQP